MTRRRLFLIALVLPILATASESSADEITQLKQRFKQRYKLLVAMKDAGKVGETSDGRVEAVKRAYLLETADPTAEKPTTIKELVSAENTDRAALYKLIAAQTKATPASVAVRNARRNFKKARPTHYLKRKDGSWIQKRDLRATKQDPK